MKKIKKIASSILILCLCFSIVSCGDKKIKENKEPVPTVQESITPLLYKVSDTNGNICWLFGSIHVGEEEFYPLPDYVYNAYDDADALAVECDIIAFEKDFSAQTAVLQNLIFKDGSTIADYISPDLYDRAVEILDENNMYMDMMDYYYPSMWFSLIDNFLYDKLDVDSDLGIDRHLMERAMEEEKEILEIESVEFQYGMLADYSMELQEILLGSSIEAYDNFEEAKESIVDLVNCWKNGDEEKLVKLLMSDTEGLTEEEMALFEEYNDSMITNRNIGMANFAEENMKTGKQIFICVGAAHVVGDGGMVDLLQERGYQVELIN